MLHDFYNFYTMSTIQQIITEHLIQNFEKYTDWHGGNADQLVYEATEFFNDRNFTADIVDIIVQATGDALDICIKCRGITRIHRSPSRPSHPYGRQPHSLIFMSTLYKATCCLPASS